MTKKTISKCAALLLCAAASFNANAQVTATNIKTTAQNTEQQTALNIVVDNAIEVVLNPQVTNVGFRLATAQDFRGAKEQTFADAFKVTSNIPYSISVKTQDEKMSNQTDPTKTLKIPVSAVSMEIVGSAAALGTVAAKQALSHSTDVVLTSNATETIEQAFTLKVSKTTDNSTAFLVPGGLYSTTLFITATQD